MKCIIPLLFCALFCGASLAGEPEYSEFTPVMDRAYKAAALDLINEARESLEIIQLEWHYDATVKEIQDALRDAKARGVTVRILIEDNIDFNQTSLRYLNQFGLETRLDTPTRMLHCKLMLADRKKLLIGSTNLSGNSIDNNHESNVLITHPETATFFGHYFDALWSDSSADPELQPVSSENLRTVINREHAGALSDLLESAQTSIRVVMYGIKYYNQPDSSTDHLLDLLRDASARGVDTRVVLDWSHYNDGLNRINQATADYLSQGGVATFRDEEEITTHAKIVVADDRVYLGSANWGYDALERRNECGVILQDPVLAQYLRTYADKLAIAPYGPPEL